MSHLGRSLLRPLRASTGLQVAPTAPQPIADDSSAGSAESFHRHVDVVWVMRKRGLAVDAGATAGAALVKFTVPPGRWWAAPSRGGPVPCAPLSSATAGTSGQHDNRLS